MQGLIELLEEFFVFASSSKRVVDINIAAGIALAELRKIKDFSENGQEAGSPTVPETKPF